MRLTLFAAAALCVSSFAAHADTLIGDTVHVSLNLPNTTTVYADDGNAVVGSGVEYSLTFFNIDFTANQILIEDKADTRFYPAPFNGYSISDLSNSFSSVSLDASSSLPGFTSSGLSFADGTIYVNLQSLRAYPGQEVVLDATTTPNVTPEPSSFALLGTGLLGVAGVVRKRFA